MQKNKLEGVYCIIGEENFLHATFDQTIKVCLENKVKLFQIRFKNKNIFFEHGQKLKNLIEEIHNHSGLVLVNDDITQIEEFNFDGIHLGQSDISPIFAKHIKRKIKNKNIICVAPDVGGVERARALGKKLDVGLAIVDKRRPSPGKSQVMNVIGNVKIKIFKISTFI